MDLGLHGKRAIITGGTKGIGRKTAELLATEGCKVGFCARNQSQVEDTVDALSKIGPKIIGGVTDVTDSQQCRNWIAQTGDALGGIDILIANASALGASADEEAWRSGLEVDVLGTVRAVEAAMPYLLRSNAASIVGISSTVAVNTPGGVRAYNGLKAALINYLSGLSTNLGADGIRANAVSPGAVYFKGGVWDTRKKEAPEVYAAALARSPLGRFCTPEEVANAVVFLASPAASFISGTNIIVDGGSTSRVQY